MINVMENLARAVHAQLALRWPGKGLRAGAALLVCASLCSLEGAEESNLREQFTGEIAPLVNRYCVTCHSTEKKKGEMDLERFVSSAEAAKEPEVWSGVLE